MSKIACIILAHHLPELTARLVNALQHPDVEFIIHIDARSDQTGFIKALPYPLPANVHFVSNRVACPWGAFGAVEATLRAMRMVVNTGKDISHVVLLSGQSYPLKSNAEIHEFFHRHAGQSFLPAIRVEHENRLYQRYRVHLPINNKLIPIPPVSSNRKLLSRILWKLIPVRQFPAYATPYKGSQWWVMCMDDVRRVLEYCDHHPEWILFFRTTQLADESFFQSTLWGTNASRDCDHIQNTSVHFIVWSPEIGRSPATLTRNDLPAMLASNALFARKFHPDVDSSVLDEIDVIRGNVAG